MLPRRATAAGLVVGLCLWGGGAVVAEAPASAPATETAPASAPAVDIAPASALATEVAPGSVPALDIAPASAPALDIAPASAPTLGIAPASAPAVDIASASAPAADARPLGLPPQLVPLYDLLGKAAPDFTLQTVDGSELALAELREDDPVIVIQFWATWCVPCYLETLIYNVMLERYEDRGLVVVGLHTNDPSAFRIPVMRARLGMDYPVAVVSDPVWEAYGQTVVLPTSFIIDRSGRVRHVKIGVKWVDEVTAILEPLLDETPAEAAAADVSRDDFLWAGLAAADAVGGGAS